MIITAIVVEAGAVATNITVVEAGVVTGITAIPVDTADVTGTIATGLDTAITTMMTNR